MRGELRERGACAELYRYTKDAERLALGLQFADRQWANATPAGLSREARDWADDLSYRKMMAVDHRGTGPRYLSSHLSDSVTSSARGRKCPPSNTTMR